MKTKTLSIVLFTGLLVCSLFAESKGIKITQEKGTIELEGNSTLHKYTCQAEKFEVSFLMDISDIKKGQFTLSLENLIVNVPVVNLESGKKMMNTKMQAALKASDHSRIVFTGFSIEFILEAAREGPQVAAVPGLIAVAGKSRSIELLTHFTIEGKSLRISGSVPLRMSDFGVEAPVMMFGALRTSDEITIKYNLVVENIFKQNEITAL